MILGSDLGITVWFRLLRPSRQRPSASDSNFRSGKEEWPACYGRRDNGLPRPILIFVAAKKNGSVCYGRRDNGFPRPILIFVAAKKNGPSATSVAAAIYYVRFYSLSPQRRMARFQNGLATASILDLTWSIWESLQVFTRKRPPACSDS